MSKSKCAKQFSSGPLLEIERLKAVTPLWCEAYFQVKRPKHFMLGPLLNVQMSFCVAGAMDHAPCQKCAKSEGFEAVSSTTTTTLHYSYDSHFTYTTLRYTNYITVRYATL